MKYTDVKEGVFISRPNRFIATVLTDGQETAVHVKNTGRLRELLTEGSTVYLQPAADPGRKTPYDLIAVLHEGRVVNIDSQAPNTIAAEWLPQSGIFSKDVRIKREVKKGDSRLDLYAEDGERKAYIEVKGVTLLENETALFPDAPTERGIKHINELISIRGEGYEAYIIFVIKRKGALRFSPNARTHGDFAAALRNAQSAGVEIIAVDCTVTPESIAADKRVKIEL